MDFTSDTVEITREIKISNFNSYQNISDEISSSLNIDAHRFSSRWELCVQPMKPQSRSLREEITSLNCNVDISLKCLYSSAPMLWTRKIGIAMWIKNREEFHRDICPTFDIVSLRYHTHIPRSLLTPFITQNNLIFYLRFTLCNDVLCKSVSAAHDIGKDISNCYNSYSNADIELITHNETTFRAHAIILNARSNLLQTCNFIKCHENGLENHSNGTKNGGETSLLETPIKNEQTMSSLHASSAISSTCSSFNLESEDGNFRNSNLSPTKRQRLPCYSPSKRATLSLSSKDYLLDSPRKSTQTQLTSYFPASPQKNLFGLSPNCKSPANLNSPSKNRFGSRTPLRPQRTPKTDSPQSSRITPLKREPSECDETPSKGRTPSLPLSVKNQNVPSNGSHSRNVEAPSTVKVYKLNMSDTIAKSFLQWIYTGEAELDLYAQPLLVGALRHGIPSLAEACQHQLTSIMNEDNVCELIQLAYKYEACLLKKSAMEFAVKHAKEVTSKENWARLLKNPNILLDFSRKISNS